MHTAPPHGDYQVQFSRTFPCQGVYASAHPLPADTCSAVTFPYANAGCHPGVCTCDFCTQQHAQRWGQPLPKYQDQHIKGAHPPQQYTMPRYTRSSAPEIPGSLYYAHHQAPPFEAAAAMDAMGGSMAPSQTKTFTSLSQSQGSHTWPARGDGQSLALGFESPAQRVIGCFFNEY